MAVKIELVSYKICPYVQRARFALEESNTPYTIRFINPYGAKPGWFNAISPLGKVPVLAFNNTQILESGIILDFINELSGRKFLPADPLERARCLMFIHRVEHYHTMLRSIFSAKNEDEFNSLIDLFKQEIKSININLDLKDIDLDTARMVELYYGPMFFLSKVIGDIVNENLFDRSVTVNAWSNSILSKESFNNTIEEDYLPELITFLRAKDSILSEYAKNYNPQ
jgi:glutathione S-transferase